MKDENYPDSWGRLEKDAGMQPHAYCVGHMLYGGEDEESTTPTNELFARDLVRRAKALAGVIECRNCKHAEELCATEKLNCMHFAQWDYYLDEPEQWLVEPDGFCAWGEPEEE